MQIKVYETNQKDHYLTYLPQRIIQHLKRKRIDIIIEEATDVQSSEGQLQLQKLQNSKDVVFLKKIISFILNAFQKFLNQRNDPKTQDLENKIEELKSLKQKSRQQSKQTQVKLEIKELKQLMEWQEGSINFSSLFIKYLKSKELKTYIDENKKIKSTPTKQDYHKAVKLVLLELQKKEKLFVKFISKKKQFKDIVLNEQEYDSFDSRSQSPPDRDSINYSQQFITRNYFNQKNHQVS